MVFGFEGKSGPMLLFLKFYPERCHFLPDISWKLLQGIIKCVLNMFGDIWERVDLGYCTWTLIAAAKDASRQESLDVESYYPIPYGLVVRIPAFHAGGPGSIPGVGRLFIWDHCFLLSHMKWKRIGLCLNYPLYFTLHYPSWPTCMRLLVILIDFNILKEKIHSFLL